MPAMEKLVAEGLIRFILVSNFNRNQLQDAENSFSNERLAYDQVLLHLGYMGIKRHLLPYCIKQGIAIVGDSPFGHGDFPSSGSRGGKVLAENCRAARSNPSPGSAQLTRNPEVFTMPKARHPEHVQENSVGFGWKLIDDDIASIDRAFSATQPDAPLESI